MLTFGILNVKRKNKVFSEDALIFFASRLLKYRPV